MLFASHPNITSGQWQLPCDYFRNGQYDSNNSHNYIMQHRTFYRQLRLNHPPWYCRIWWREEKCVMVRYSLLAKCHTVTYIRVLIESPCRFHTPSPFFVHIEGNTECERAWLKLRRCTLTDGWRVRSGHHLCVLIVFRESPCYGIEACNTCRVLHTHSWETANVLLPKY